MFLKDLVEINPPIKLEKGKEYPFLQMEDIEPGHRYVFPKTKRQFDGGGSRFRNGDVLFARITPCLENGKIAQFKSSKEEAFGSTEFIVFREKTAVSYQPYIYYLVSTDIVRKPAEKSMFGASGRQRADLSLIKNIEVPNVPLPTQRKIAAVLSAYDDLIENNLRRIKILGDIAQNLYSEWFVKFRFPRHEKTRMIDSPVGKIPEGWEVKKLGEVLSHNIGGGWGGEENRDDLIPAYVIRGTDIPSARYADINGCPLRFHKPSNLKSRKIEAYDIVFEVAGGSKDQPLGRALLVGKNVIRAFDADVMCASFCKLIRVNRNIISPELVYLEVGCQ